MSFLMSDFEEFDGASSVSTVASLFNMQAPETRRVTQITGFAPASNILKASEDARFIAQTQAMKAPPRDISPSLVRDFVSGRRNAVSCLNEYSQLRRIPYTFKETNPSVCQSFSGRPMFAFNVTVNGDKYPVGEGTSKKEAKVAAAKNALNQVLELNCDHRIDDRKDHDEHLYGPKITVKPVALPPPRDNKDEVHNSNVPNMITRTLNTHEVVGKLSNDHIQELLESCPKLLYAAMQSAFACIVVKREGMQGQVVSLGVGDSSYFSKETVTDGSVLFDCHAEVIARRGFKRYLISELIKWHFSSLQQREFSIFGTVPDTPLLHIRDSVTVHLYVSKQPTGFAREFVGSRVYVDGLCSGKVVETEDVNLRYITEGGKVCDVLLGDSSLNSPHDHSTSVTMSGTDKLTMWTSCGLQGAPLSMFLEPIYLTSITIGNYRGALPDGRLIGYPINSRVDEDLCAEFPGCFINDLVSKIQGYRAEEVPLLKQYEDIDDLSINWTVGDHNVEVVTPSTGSLHPKSPHKDTNGLSRICKRSIHASILDLGDKFAFANLDTSRYINMKNQAQMYVKTKQVVIENLKQKNYGEWVSRSQSVNSFMAT